MVEGRFIAEEAQEVSGEGGMSALPEVQSWSHTSSSRSLGREGESVAELSPKTRG